MSLFTEAQLEEMRQIGLRLDKAGRFWHQGVEVSHPRMRQALLRWLDVRDDGRNIVKLDEQRHAYVEVEAEHLRAVSAHWESDACFVTWDDGESEELPYAQLQVAADHALLVPARHGKLRGRIAGAAYQTIMERLAERADGMYVLRARGQDFAIAAND